ncbi:TetR family transcriptional regulator [Ilumatobacter coccineus]|uniref:Putative TetR family transcriptional regulator n=1 Tax=Ilumatobacter coccineus (strain NBRC 103263 / KCTC 29153 / YM16-304) TaxID=1313172 RepID=A0A6C7E148_ILUCY|nr:TetR family transcriptional regulator [Ilumatobacter coccineus]BAN00653.1 putative TetR family transcriptional regulator [Ilumatobacter coccineus YM16-304]
MSDLATRIADLRAADEPGPAKRRKNAQRRRIFAAAVELYEENGGEDGGLDKTTVEAIAERSDISVRTFFRYFETKADAIYVDLPSSMDDHVALTRLLLDDLEPADAILAASIVQMTDMTNDPDDVARMRRSLKSKHFVERSGAFHNRWRNELTRTILPFVPDQPDRFVVARAIVTSCLDVRDSALSAWAAGGGDADLVETLDRTIAIWKRVWSDEVPTQVADGYDRRES